MALCRHCSGPQQHFSGPLPHCSGSLYRAVVAFYRTLVALYRTVCCGPLPHCSGLLPHCSGLLPHCGGMARCFVASVVFRRVLRYSLRHHAAVEPNTAVHFFCFCIPSFLKLFSPFFIIIYILCLPPSRSSDPGYHSRLFSPPLPTTVRAFRFYREKISALSSLGDSRRIVITHARRSQQLTSFFILQLN